VNPPLSAVNRIAKYLDCGGALPARIRVESLRELP
jgi:hypothetical protein